MSDKFGEISWSDNVSEGERRMNNKDLFLKLGKGSNIVRLVTQPHQYIQHKWKPEGDPGFGYRVMCSKPHGSCPLCAQNDKPKHRWLLGVIDRKTNTYKVLDISVSVFKAIQSLVKDEDWGDPSKYDIDIKVDQSAGPAGYYTVAPKPHKALSANDLKIKEEADLDELRRRVTPITPEKVQERIDKILSGGNVPVVSASGAKESKSTNVDSSNDGDDDTDFPDFDAKSSF